MQILMFGPDMIVVTVWHPILPSVAIGDNTVIGAGSVVAKDIPANAVSGYPCRAMRENGERDGQYYDKDREIPKERRQQ